MPPNRHRAKALNRVNCKSIQVYGTVQGVGFRPFVYRLAKRHGLRGWVRNGSSNVRIVVQGTSDSIDSFLDDLRTEAPPLARIESVAVSRGPAVQQPEFEIRSSFATAHDSQPVPPDVATCADCLHEMFDPADRRYRYPFINCTNCGPRLTIIDGVPYDRKRTTMAKFQMCRACQREYEDPLDRRFHAQPNACAQCGPRVTLLDADGSPQNSGDPITAAAERLTDGTIGAIKGIGGFHLAVDARNEDAVRRLRARKHREERPLALMAGDLETTRALCHTNEYEEALLAGPQRPIVLLKRREACRTDCQSVQDAKAIRPIVAPSVAPGHRDLGVMLPYSPLHHLLFADLKAFGDASPLLVLTSGNLTDEPIAFADDEVLERLKTIADFFLTHDRAIRTRCDDSVTRCLDSQEVVIRRSRGYTPRPIAMPFEFPESILACGAHLKNTFCFGMRRHALLSHHIGDLDNYLALRSFTDGIEHFKRLFDTQPTVVAHDLHPDYLATKYAHELQDVRLIGVQHHHAHIASVLAENSLSGPVIGVAMDGTGLGLDGRIWGAEFLIADFNEFTRAAHLDYVPLPGGEQAIREPWRMAASYLYRVFGDQFLGLNLPVVHELDRNKWRVLQQMIEQNMNCPLASSMGRMFDAVAAIATGRKTVAYEGQSAVELELLADPAIQDAYEFKLRIGTEIKPATRSQALAWEQDVLEAPASLTCMQEPGNELRTNAGSILASLLTHGPTVGRAMQIDPNQVIRSVVADLQKGETAATVSARFHNSVANMIARVCRSLRSEYELEQVALSGGVFQNAFLLSRTLKQLRSDGFDVYINNKVPPNDGGISLGQAAVAAARLGAKPCA